MLTGRTSPKKRHHLNFRNYYQDWLRLLKAYLKVEEQQWWLFINSERRLQNSVEKKLTIHLGPTPAEYVLRVMSWPHNNIVAV